MWEMNYLTAHMAMPHEMTSFSQSWGQILKYQPGHCSVIHDGRLLNEHRWARLGRGSGRFATRRQTICHLRETQLHETIADQTRLLVIEWEQQIMGHRDELQEHGHWVIGQNLKIPAIEALFLCTSSWYLHRSQPLYCWSIQAVVECRFEGKGRHAISVVRSLCSYKLSTRGPEILLEILLAQR
jgi:hypothetical protein